MPLKDILSVANKVYNISGGSRKTLKNLEAFSESELLTEIPKALQNKEIGTQLTKNLVDVLVCLVQFYKYEISNDDVIKTLKKLADEQNKVFSATWIFSYDPSLIESYKTYIEAAKNFHQKLAKERADEKTIVQERLIAEYSAIKKQMNELEKQKNELQEKYDAAIQENLDLSVKIQKIKKLHQDDLQKNSHQVLVLQQENFEIKNFLAGKRNNSNQKIIIEELADYLIADLVLEKNYLEINKLFSTNETLVKLCKDTIDNIYKKAANFYSISLFYQGNNVYHELKKLEKTVLDTIALIAVYSYNQNKKDIGFLKSKPELSPPHTPRGKVPTNDNLPAKIKGFCEEIIKRLRDVEQGFLSELAIYLRKPELTKKLLEEYSRHKMNYPVIAFQALDDKRISVSPKSSIL